MSGGVAEYTTHYSMEVPQFDFPSWHTYYARNLYVIDALLFDIIGTSALQGGWRNGVLYGANDQVIDRADGTIWECLVSHTAAADGTFADDRAANPTYWGAVIPTDIRTDAELTYVSATEIKLVRNGGTRIFVGGVNYLIPEGGVSFDHPDSGVANTLYYVYVGLNNVNDLQLFLQTTPPAMSEYGILTDTNSSYYTLVGMVKLNASKQFVDSPTQRFVRSYYHDRGIRGRNTAILSGITGTDTLLTGLKMEFLSWENEVIDVSYMGTAKAAAGTSINLKNKFNGTTNDASITIDAIDTNYRNFIGTRHTIRVLPIGYNYADPYVTVSAATDFVLDGQIVTGGSGA